MVAVVDQLAAALRAADGAAVDIDAALRREVRCNPRAPGTWTLCD